MRTKNTKKKRSPALPVLLGIVIALAALVILMSQYLVVDFRFYPRSAKRLDLRGKEISVRHYEKLEAKLPDCDILWDVPFQGGSVSSSAETVTVTSLTEADAAALGYLHHLKTVDARQCRDYAVLARLQESLPETRVEYGVIFGGTSVPADTRNVTIRAIGENEIGDLRYLKNLESVTVTGDGDAANFGALQDYCHENGIPFFLSIGGETVSDDVETLTAAGINDGDLDLLPLLKNLRSLYMQSPQAEADHVIALAAAQPEVDIRWDQTLGAMTLTQDMEEIDLSALTFTSLEEAERVLAYFPKVKTVFFGEQNISHEDMAAYRDRVRDRYKVVWTVRLGQTGVLRTDITYFMPGRDWARGPVFGDDISYNLRYCEDLICVDVGHLGSVKTVKWLEGMPNLEYLILSHTDVRSLEGIQACKKLKFLEITDCGIRDFTPLKECTALEDLNFSNAYPDVTPLFEMPWLKNIYMIFGNGGDAWELSQALPDAHIVATGERTVGGGWRKLPNYFAMRDALHAPYMSG